MKTNTGKTKNNNNGLKGLIMMAAIAALILSCIAVYADCGEGASGQNTQQSDCGGNPGCLNRDCTVTYLPEGYYFGTCQGGDMSVGCNSDELTLITIEHEGYCSEQCVCVPDMDASFGGEITDTVVYDYSCDNG